MVEPLSWPDYFHHKLCTDWVLSPTCKENCSNYFLRHWEAKYFKLQLFFNADWGYFYIIGADGTKYRVIVKDQPYTTAVTDKYEQLALSFRSPKVELNLPAYVLVKGIAS